MNRKQHGSVILEITLAFPLLACVVFTALKFSNDVRAYQAMATLSSEAGGRAFRECGSLASDLTRHDDPQETCLQNVAQSLNAFAAASLPGTNVIVSVYRSDSAGNVLLPEVGGVNATTQLSGNGYASRFNKTIVGNRYSFLNTNNRVIAIGEVFWRQGTLLPAIPFIYRPPVEVLYDTTVF